MTTVSLSGAGQRNPDPMMWLLFGTFLILFSLGMRAIL